MKNVFSVTLVLSALLIISNSALAIVAKVPEPSSFSLLGVALLVAGIIGRKK